MLKYNTPLVDPLPEHEAPLTEWGAAGVATAGRVTVEVDRTITTKGWQFSVETPAFYLRLSIDSPDVLTRLYEFLTAHNHTTLGEFALGLHGTQNIDIVRDDEPGDRIFIVMNAGEKSSLRLTLVDEEVRHWAEAIKDVCDQLGS